MKFASDTPGNYHTMTAFVTLVYWWIYGELMEIKILELLSDAEFFCSSFYVNFIFLYSCFNSQQLKMCHNLSDQKIVYVGAH